MFLIAGPCAIESRETVKETARVLKAVCEKLGIRLYFKSSFDKANRTSCSARGVGMARGLEILSDVKRLVSALPSSQREVLEMRYYMNMSFKEIAETTGVSINTALGRMRYAILNLRRIADERHIVLTF